MTQEEKARAYDEALNRAIKHRNNDGLTLEQYETIDIIFPKLKEDEDERIRKWIIDDIRYNMNNEPLNNSEYKKEAEKAIAWLEKLCYKQQSKTALEAAKEEKVDNANKVEPKFHEGDWVTNSIETVQITGYDIDYGYQVNYKGKLLHRDTDIIEKEYHLWTIKDAKDGEVLASGHIVFIFKVIHGVWLNCHCSAHNDGSFIADSYDLMTNKYFSEVHPATKEQRDFLFAKMKEAGYEWDAEKKVMKKFIEEKSPAESLGISQEKYEEIVNECIYGSDNEQVSSEKIGKNDTLYDLLNKMPSCITVDGIDYHFVLKKTIVYMAFYEGEGEGSGKVIFWMAGNPIDLLTAMLKKLKAEGLLDG